MKRLYLWAIALASVAFVALVTVAYADTVTVTASAPSPSAIVVPYGDTIKWIFDNFDTLIVTVILALVARVVALLPGPIGSLVNTVLTEQVLKRAIDYGINAVEGATTGGQLSIPVASAVLANAVNKTMASAPSWLINWMGGTDGISAKIFARLNLVPEATIATVAPSAAVPQVVAVSVVAKAA